MEPMEVKSLIWAQKGKLYIIYENVFLSINEKNWFAESRFCVGVHWMEFADTMLGISEQYLFFCHQTGMAGH
jgi:hypothetical protein